MLKRLVSAFAFATTLAHSALASGHEANLEINWWGLGSHYADRPAMGWYIITFAIFLAGLLYAIRKPISLYLETRSSDIRKAIEEAKIAKQEADKRLKEYEQRLAELDSDIARMKDEFVRQGEAEKAVLRQNADRMAEQISKDTEDVIAAEIRRAMLTLKKEAAEQVIKSVGEEIKARVSKQMELGMRETFVRDVSDVRH